MRVAESLSAQSSRYDEIYLAVSTLFEHQTGAFSKQERGLAADILKRISKDVEMSIRIGVAQRLAGDENAPHELVLLLADDKIEVARPILARSPILSDEDLIRVIEKGSKPHQISIAERPSIGVTVSAALARSECEAAIIALLRNVTAKIAAETFELLSERARRLSRLQEPLTQRPDLPPEVAQKLHAWVSGALKTALAQRYPEVSGQVSHAVEQTRAAHRNEEPPVPEANAIKLVSKLFASGQLRSSFLIRVLNQGQMELFEHAFATLLSMDVEIMRRALYGASPTTVALACRAAGIDRSVFMTVFQLSRHHRQLTAQLSDSDLKQIWAVFNEVPKAEALDRLRAQAA
ncbi:MAG: hypothetical protein QOF03_746 [Alphaproteobacteria bacterium]|jgi:uncharacterized protein (DUF2336 family)|nr:hypothetical protein [Alphaproteobacteria bacterium]